MILCDSGPLIAAFNRADADHARCVRFLAENWSRLVVPSLAVTEIHHLVSDRSEAVIRTWLQNSGVAIADDELRII